MYCLKCGKEAEDNRVFCAHCLEVMEAYPVKQGISIQLPNRPAPAPAKKTARRHKAVPAEEQVQHLKRSVRVLSLMLVVVSILLAITAALHFIPEQTPAEDDPGKNYTVETED